MDIVSSLLISVMRGSPTWNFSLVTKIKQKKKKGIKSSPLRVVDWEPTHRLVGGISGVGWREVTTMRRRKEEVEKKRVVVEGWEV